MTNPCRERLQQGLQSRQPQAHRGRLATLLCRQEPAQMLQTWRNIPLSNKMDTLSQGEPLWAPAGL